MSTILVTWYQLERHSCDSSTLRSLVPQRCRKNLCLDAEVFVVDACADFRLGFLAKDAPWDSFNIWQLLVPCCLKCWGFWADGRAAHSDIGTMPLLLHFAELLAIVHEVALRLFATIKVIRLGHKCPIRFFAQHVV
jgi:hypothetical protein